jgi:hypothetical protein
LTGENFSSAWEKAQIAEKADLWPTLWKGGDFLAWGVFRNQVIILLRCGRILILVDGEDSEVRMLLEEGEGQTAKVCFRGATLALKPLREPILKMADKRVDFFMIYNGEYESEYGNSSA